MKIISDNINTIYKRYKKISLWIIAALMLVCLFIMSIMQDNTMVNSLLISVIYSLISTFAYAVSWKHIAKSSPISLSKFYMAASALRMLSAFSVFLIYCLVVRQHDAIIRFVIIFFAFYIILLIHDCIYFSMVEKRNTKL